MKSKKKEKVESVDNSPAKHWKGMPEFVSENKQPVKQITVGFANKEDMLKFSKLVGQVITAKTRSIWYPAIPNTPMFNKRYIDSKPNKK